MRKLIVMSFLTLDGVMQAPGGPEEDPTGGFKHGGWVAGYFDDFLGKVTDKQMSKPFDLLLGRKTYEIFPITVGNGKRLFAEGTVAAGFELVESRTSPTGVIVASYKSAGKVRTGSFALEVPTEAELARRRRLKDEE
jgi:hypothetical protein